VLRAWRENVERGVILGGSGFRAPEIVAIGLVDGDHVGQFNKALLDALQFVARAGQHQRQKEIRHVADSGFRLADADRLHQHHIEAGGFAQQHRLARFCGDAAERAR
jgi:hypothetical protein